MSPAILKILVLGTKTLQGEEKTICQHSELRYHLFKVHTLQECLSVSLQGKYHKAVVVGHACSMLISCPGPLNNSQASTNLPEMSLLLFVNLRQGNT